MKPRDFQLEDERVVAAIAEAERKTSGQICVFISSRTLGGDHVEARAGARFRKLGMEKTRERNGVLLYFVPRDRKYAVIGDHGIHEKCGDTFWQEIASALGQKLSEDKFTDAVVEAVARAGDALATHFPKREDGRNELPNEVFRDNEGRGMRTARKISLGIMAVFFVVAGINHFRSPEVYMGIMPPYLPWPLGLIYISGLAEIAGGIGVLVPVLRRAAAWGLIALLVAVFPANIQGALHGMSFGEHPIAEWMLWARLPLQFLLIAWVWRTGLGRDTLDYGTISG